MLTKDIQECCRLPPLTWISLTTLLLPNMSTITLKSHLAINLSEIWKPQTQKHTLLLKWRSQILMEESENQQSREVATSMMAIIYKEAPMKHRPTDQEVNRESQQLSKDHQKWTIMMTTVKVLFDKIQIMKDIMATIQTGEFKTDSFWFYSNQTFVISY